METKDVTRVFLGVTCFAILFQGTFSKNDSPRGVIETAKQEIHIGAFVPQLKSDKFGYFTAMKMAIQIINDRSDILNNYTLVLDAENTIGINGGNAIRAFFNLVTKKNKPVMLLGPANPVVLEPIAEAAPNWKLVQVSYVTSTTKFEFSNYRNTYHATPASSSYIKAMVAFIKYYGWQRVAILRRYGLDVYSQPVVKLKSELENNNISIVTGAYSTQGDVSFQMQKLKYLDARIIIGSFPTVEARSVFCEAFKKKMYGSRYAWILFGDIDPKGKLDDDSKEMSSINCSSRDIKRAADGYISTRKPDLRQDNIETISGMTSESFWKKMKQLKRKNQQKLEKDSAYAFDAAWIIALALNASFAKGMTYKKLLKRKNKDVLAIRKGIEYTNFQGITGLVRFDKTKQRIGTVILKQNRGGRQVKIGEHFTSSGELHIFESQRHKIWRGKHPPKDRTIAILKFVKNPLPLIVFMWSMAATGIICSLSFLYFNISKRKNRIIKMSSPKLNNIIIIGCILCYASVFLFGLDTRFLALKGYGINCNLRTAVLSVGFSLSFGAMFSKTWRVHKIFTAATANKKMAIRDLHLLAMEAGLLSVDVVFLSCWFAMDPLQAEQLSFEEAGMKSPDEQDIIIIPALYHCTCRYKSYFLGALFAYKGILLLFGLFLAWETRNVTIPALNDSKYIGMSVYNVFVLATIGVIVAIALDGSMYYEAPYAISSLCLIVCTTVTLLLVFVPKIYQFRVKGVAATTSRALRRFDDEANSTPAESHVMTCASSVLKESKTSFTSKATQTDCDDPGSADEVVFENQGFITDEVPEEKRLDDIHLNETVAADLSPLSRQTVATNEDRYVTSSSLA